MVYRKCKIKINFHFLAGRSQNPLWVFMFKEAPRKPLNTCNMHEIQLDLILVMLCFIFVDCGQSGAVEAGYTVSGSTVYGGTPSVTCASGYAGTPGTTTCQADGSWSGFTGCIRGTPF